MMMTVTIDRQDLCIIEMFFAGRDLSVGWNGRVNPF